MTDSLDPVRAAGAVTNPGSTERLHEYWVRGPGAEKIRWGQPGDYDRCVLHLGKFLADPHGYCAKAHHDALGIWPATHAAAEKKATGRAAMADTSKPYGDVKYADPKNGKYPIDTEAHARAAWSYINQAKNAAMYPMNGVTLGEVKDRIKAACKKFGIDVAEPASSGRAESLAAYTRAFPLEDLSVRTTRDGRIVDAYIAVFDTDAEIRDQDGHYMENLDPVVFNRAISDAAPQGGRKHWRTGVFYNHAMTLHGTPSEQFSVPVAQTQDLKADGHGVRATDKYYRDDFCDSIVDRLESGGIPGYSFSGRFKRSQPLIPRGGFRPDRAGNLQTIRRLESTLREYGPTPFPAYEGAQVLGVRSDVLLGAMMNDPDMAMRMLAMFRGSAPEDSLPPAGAPPDGDSPAEDSHQPLVRSGRSVRQEMQAARSAFLQRHRR